MLEKLYRLFLTFSAEFLKKAFSPIAKIWSFRGEETCLLLFICSSVSNYIYGLIGEPTGAYNYFFVYWSTAAFLITFYCFRCVYDTLCKSIIQSLMNLSRIIWSGSTVEWCIDSVSSVANESSWDARRIPTPPPMLSSFIILNVGWVFSKLYILHEVS